MEQRTKKTTTQFMSIAVAILIFCVLSLVVVGQETEQQKHLVDQVYLLDKLKNADTIENVSFKAEDLISAMLNVGEEGDIWKSIGVYNSIEVHNSHIIGNLKLWKLGVEYKPTPEEIEDWNVSTGQNTMMIPWSIKIRNSIIDEVNTLPRILEPTNKSDKRIIFKHRISFADSKIFDADFRNAIFLDITYFRGVRFEFADFSNAHFSNVSIFSETRFEKGIALFYNATFQKFLDFQSAVFDREVMIATFDDAIFTDTAFFQYTKFRCPVDFDDVTFKDAVSFNQTEFDNVVEFGDTSFKYPRDSSLAFLRASQAWGRYGDRGKADYYYYKYKVAERKQKPWYKQWFEWIFIDLTSGYGTNWHKILGTWGVIILICAFTFWFSKGLQSTSIDLNSSFWQFFWPSLYFSMATFVSFNISEYKPNRRLTKVVAIAEALMGAFMVALFIVVFARAFMR